MKEISLSYGAVELGYNQQALEEIENKFLWAEWVLFTMATLLEFNSFKVILHAQKKKSKDFCQF